MIDIEKIKAEALDALNELNDCARMEYSIYAIDTMNHLAHFINTVCERLEAAERGLSTYTEMYNRVYDELESAEKDAARYQWLLANRSYFYPMQQGLVPSECGIDFQWQQRTYAERNFSVSEAVDGYIEAIGAMKET